MVKLFEKQQVRPNTKAFIFVDTSLARQAAASVLLLIFLMNTFFATGLFLILHMLTLKGKRRKIASLTYSLASVRHICLVAKDIR